jgi:predicted amidohydrolase
MCGCVSCWQLFDAKKATCANLATHRQVLREAASADCDLAVFPEMSLTGSVDPAAHPERLIGLDDAAVSRRVRESARAGVGVCFGIAERAPGAGQPLRQRDGSPARLA